MRRLALMLAVLSLTVIFAAACGNANPISKPSASASLTTLTSKTFRFAISYDATKYNEKDGPAGSAHFSHDFMVWAREKVSNYIGLSDDFVEIQVVSSTRAADFLTGDVQTFRKDGIQVEPTSFHGMKAFGAELVSEDANWHNWDVLFVHSNTYYRISAACPAKKWSREGPRLMAIVKSFRLTD